MSRRRGRSMTRGGFTRTCVEQKPGRRPSPPPEGGGAGAGAPPGARVVEGARPVRSSGPCGSAGLGVGRGNAQAARGGPPGPRDGGISSHRQSRWYEEGPLKGPSVEARLALVPILVEVRSLTEGPLAPGVRSSHSLGEPLHVGSTRPLRTWPSSCPSVPSSMGAVANPRRERQSLEESHRQRRWIHFDQERRTLLDSGQRPGNRVLLSFFADSRAARH
jgi:hypothetical protein